MVKLRLIQDTLLAEKTSLASIILSLFYCCLKSVVLLSSHNQFKFQLVGTYHFNILWTEPQKLVTRIFNTKTKQIY